MGQKFTHEESTVKRDISTHHSSRNSGKTDRIFPPFRTQLAWCSSKNEIRIVELKTKKEVTNFDGAQLVNRDLYSHGWTHVKEIANTGFLVSVYHFYDKSANLQVFDISRKGQVRKIYSFEEVTGITGWGDVAYNQRRRLLGAISVGGKIAYHLYNFSMPKADNIVKLARKSKWHSQYSTEYQNVMAGIDFNPDGETVATIDRYGTCLISDMNTDKYHFHMKMEMEGSQDLAGRCKWSTNAGEPLLFVKYDDNQLNILDAEEKALILKSPIQLDEFSTFGIDVCQSNGNLLVSGGDDKRVKVFDKREAAIVRTFIDPHNKWIHCVRWSPSGDMIATASQDRTVRLLEFKTGKVLYTGTTSTESTAMSVCFI